MINEKEPKLPNEIPDDTPFEEPMPADPLDPGFDFPEQEPHDVLEESSSRV